MLKTGFQSHPVIMKEVMGFQLEHPVDESQLLPVSNQVDAMKVQLKEMTGLVVKTEKANVTLQGLTVISAGQRSLYLICPFSNFLDTPANVFGFASGLQIAVQHDKMRRAVDVLNRQCAMRHRGIELQGPPKIGLVDWCAYTVNTNQS